VIRAIIIFTLFAAFELVAASIIPEDRKTGYWTNSGVWGRGPNGNLYGLPTNRTVFSNLDGITKDGSADVKAAIQSIINAASAAGSRSNIQVLFVTNDALFRLDSVLDWKSFVEMERASWVGRTNVRFRINHSGSDAFMFTEGLGAATPKSVVTSTAVKGSSNIWVTASVASELTEGNTAFISHTNCNIARTSTGYENPAVPTTCNYCSVEGTSTNRSMAQGIVITSIQNGTNITFWPPLKATFTNNVQLYHYVKNASERNCLEMAGLRGITIERATGVLPVHMMSVIKAKDVYFLDCVFYRNADRGIFYTTMVVRGQVYGCDFIDIFGGGSTSGEGFLGFPGTYDWKIEHNLFNGVRNPMSLNGPAMGNVFAYNLVTNMINVNSNVLVTDLSLHGAHPMFNLFEGNLVHKAHFDIIHGSASHNTLFRNILLGRQGPRGGIDNDAGMGCVWIDATNHYMNVVGNVLGYSGVTNDITSWQNEVMSPAGDGFNGGGALYVERYSYAGYSRGLVDPVVTNTVIEHMNFSYFTGQTNMDPNIAETALEDSLYLLEPPEFDTPFPPFGPDVVAQGEVFTLSTVTNLTAGWRLRWGTNAPLRAASEGGTPAIGPVGQARGPTVLKGALILRAR
jgi:hypothetical protein